VHALKLGMPPVAVRDTREIGKRDMKLSEAMPRIDVDPETYAVRADRRAPCPASRRSPCPVAQRYFLF
jgi:urease subunit alpha